MPIDASIYNNLKTPQTELQSPLAIAEGAMRMSNLGMQNRQMQIDMANQQAMRDAYSKNIDQNGNLNQQGFLADIGRVSPQAAMSYQKQLNEMTKVRAETQSAQMDAAQKIVGQTLPSMQYLAGLPEDQRAKAYSSVMKQLSDQGVPMQNVPPQYDPDWFKQSYMTLVNTKQHLDNQKTLAETANYQALSNKNTQETTEIPSKIAKNISEKQHLDAETYNIMGGRPIQPEQADKLANIDSALHMVGDLRGTIKANNSSFGPVAGRVLPYSPYATRTKSVDALMEKGTQIIGTALQGGVLDHESFKKFQGMLPQITDTPTVAQNKLDQLQRMLEAKKNAYLEDYGNSRFNVRNFDTREPTDINVLHPKSAKPSSGNAVAAPPVIKPGTEEDGFVFNGGDPSDQRNWKRAK